MAAIIPVTRFLVGTTIGIQAAIVPMTVAGVPFFARLVQNALREVRSDVTDMGLVSGGTHLQVIRSVQLSEALPALGGALTVNTIAMIEYSAIAGSIGAGGVGNLAITYGYNRFDDNIMIATVIASDRHDPDRPVPRRPSRQGAHTLTSESLTSSHRSI